MIYVNLDPTGTSTSLFAVIVEAHTGVTYISQSGGHACCQNEMQGFLIPVNTGTHEQEMENFFKRYHCASPQSANHWSKQDLEELRLLVQKIPCWLTKNTLPTADGAELHHLEFDETRLDDCMEGWIPVITPYGKGVLAFQNCD